MATVGHAGAVLGLTAIFVFAMLPDTEIREKAKDPSAPGLALEKAESIPESRLPVPIAKTVSDSPVREIHRRGLDWRRPEVGGVASDPLDPEALPVSSAESGDSKSHYIGGFVDPVGSIDTMALDPEGASMHFATKEPGLLVDPLSLSELGRDDEHPSADRPIRLGRMLDPDDPEDARYQPRNRPRFVGGQIIVEPI